MVSRTAHARDNIQNQYNMDYYNHLRNPILKLRKDMESYNNKLTVEIPEGYEIDNENSTSTHIRLKKTTEPKRWRDWKGIPITGWKIVDGKKTEMEFNVPNLEENNHLFATKELAEAAIAMAQLTQIRYHDGRFGKLFTKEELENTDIVKYSILPYYDLFFTVIESERGGFLSFEDDDKAMLFIEENEDLLKKFFLT